MQEETPPLYSLLIPVFRLVSDLRLRGSVRCSLYSLSGPKPATGPFSRTTFVEVEVPPPLVRAPPSVDIPRLLHPYQRGRSRNSNVRR
jgi:hypothetical protein